MKPHSATGLIDRLEASGLVSRHSSAQDRRLSVLELTPRAHALLFSLSATHREEIRRLKPLLTELLLTLRSLHARSCGLVRQNEPRVAIAACLQFLPQSHTRDLDTPVVTPSVRYCPPTYHPTPP